MNKGFVKLEWYLRGTFFWLFCLFSFYLHYQMKHNCTNEGRIKSPDAFSILKKVFGAFLFLIVLQTKAQITVSGGANIYSENEVTTIVNKTSDSITTKSVGKIYVHSDAVVYGLQSLSGNYEIISSEKPQLKKEKKEEKLSSIKSEKLRDKKEQKYAKTSTKKEVVDFYKFESSESDDVFYSSTKSFKIFTYSPSYQVGNTTRTLIPLLPKYSSDSHSVENIYFPLLATRSYLASFSVRPPPFFI